MKNTLMKKLIFSLTSIVLALAVIVTASFAWFITTKKSTSINIEGGADISIQGYVLRFYESDTAEKDIFVSDGGKYPVDLNDEDESLVGDEGALSDLDLKNYLKFVFIITNNNTDYGCDISLKLSNFADYVFSYFDDYVSEYTSISGGTTFTKESAVKTLAKQYNAKFSLYFDKVGWCLGNDYDETNEETYSKELDMTSISLDSEPFLWKYSTGTKVFSNEVEIPKGQSATLTFQIRNQQSNESIDSYRSWMINDYGASYLSIYKYDSDYSSLSSTNQNYINSYLQYFVNTEINTIYTESSTVIQETRLLLKYFDFIGELEVN